MSMIMITKNKKLTTMWKLKINKGFQCLMKVTRAMDLLVYLVKSKINKRRGKFVNKDNKDIKEAER